MDQYCTVTFSGDHGGMYYVSCDQVKYITNELTNKSSDTIYLYPTINSDRDYNYIRINSLGTPEYRQDGSYNTWVNINNVSDVQFNTLSHVYRESSLVLLFTLFVVCIASIVKVARG